MTTQEVGAMTYTPGPWEWDSKKEIIIGQDGRPIIHSWRDLDELAANGRLICAAPELLEEGQKLANELRGMLALLKDHAGVVGWTNIACLCQRLDNFDAVVTKAEQAQ